MRLQPKVFFTNLVLACTVIYLFISYINFMESKYDETAKTALLRNEFDYFDETFAGDLSELSKRSEIDSSRKVIVLLWNEFFHNFDYMFGADGKQTCPDNNCLFTSNRNILPIEKYDAIVFHGTFYDGKDAPVKRNPSQYYAIVTLEPPVRFQLLDDFTDFFNWTLTYRFDSDFMWPYFKIKNRNGDVVSPALDPKWEQYDPAVVTESLVPTLKEKSTAVAWFVSHCNSNNRREKYIKKLQQYIPVDVYGKCGPQRCSRKNETECFELLRNKYYFYISFENSHCIDYMTEKAYNGLMYDTIPVVFGRVNFTNYIPPHSYLDADVLEPQQLAEVMKKLIANPAEYAKYFWWKPYYTFHNLGNEYLLIDPDLHPFCEMCKALRDVNRPHKTYKNFKKWWNSDPKFSKETSVCVRPRIP